MKPATKSVAGHLVVFTDAKGSTELDEVALNQAKPTRTGSSRAAILKLREDLFAGQISRLGSANGWKIVKSVGDALVLYVSVPMSPDGPKQVERCLKDLYRAWRHFNRCDVRIRIAVHYAEASHVVSGHDLSTTLKTALKRSSLDSLQAFLASLRCDIFGPGINRSARLAHAPSGSLFVVSQNVVLKLLGRTNAFSRGELIGLYAGQKPLYPGLPLRGPIPLVKMKGVDSVGFRNLAGRKSICCPEPWWIWEFTDEELETQSFGAENKRFQVVRLVQAIMDEKRTLKQRWDGDEDSVRYDKAFDAHLQDSLPFAFFSDLVLKVAQVWTYYRPSDDRDFEGQTGLKWEQVSLRASKFLPYYVVFASSPNEATDSIVRDALVKVGHKTRFEAISYLVHRGIRWADDATVEAGTAPANYVYLVFFQIKSSALGDGANPQALFKGLGSKCGDNGYKWNVISKSLVKGDKDGFVLLSLAKGKRDEEDMALRRFLELQCAADTRYRASFWERIAPIRMLRCNPHSQMSRLNLNWLRECIDLD